MKLREALECIEKLGLENDICIVKGREKILWFDKYLDSEVSDIRIAVEHTMYDDEDDEAILKVEIQ